jgi:plasmid stability protein
MPLHDINFDIMEGAMAQVLIRNIDDETMASLRARAEMNGRSLEQELRTVLKNAAPLTPDELVAASRRLRAAFASEEIDIRAAIRWGRDDEFEDLELAFDRA